LVRTTAQELPAGPNRVFWDGIDSHGDIVPSGVYLFQIRKSQSVMSAKGVWIR
jgi:flagellar hook assembly protein FlgD